LLSVALRRAFQSPKNEASDLSKIEIFVELSALNIAAKK